MSPDLAASDGRGRNRGPAPASERPGVPWDLWPWWKLFPGFVLTLCLAVFRPARLLDRCRITPSWRRVVGFLVVVHLCVGVLVAWIGAIYGAIIAADLRSAMGVAFDVLLGRGGPATTEVPLEVADLAVVPILALVLSLLHAPCTPWFLLQIAALLTAVRVHGKGGRQGWQNVRPLAYGTAVFVFWLFVWLMVLVCAMATIVWPAPVPGMVQVMGGVLWPGCFLGLPLAMLAHWCWFGYRWAQRVVGLDRPWRVLLWTVPAALTLFPVFYVWVMIYVSVLSGR